MAKRTSRNQVTNPHESDPRDRCYTPAYALDPLLVYLPAGVVWESAAGEGHLVRALQSAGREVVATEICSGHDYFIATPPPHAVQVTNPPYSTKYHWIARAYDIGRPFALLMPLETLGAWGYQQHARRHGGEVLILNKRVNFHMPNMELTGSGANFPVAWFCWQLLPSPLVYGDITPRPDGQTLLI
jgi:hypothetical protein